MNDGPWQFLFQLPFLNHKRGLAKLPTNNMREPRLAAAIMPRLKTFLILLFLILLSESSSCKYLISFTGQAGGNQDGKEAVCLVTEVFCKSIIYVLVR
ncbi:hypothetical protein BHE74_00057149 [Ensete ventricosum]|nr:hypothetical protein BHE74_00057149 [Ensete ventricosum]